MKEFVAHVRRALVDLNIPHMLVGSFAASLYGLTRATQNLDIVIAPSRLQLVALLQHFPDEPFYVSESAAIDAWQRGSQFNVIDNATGWKIDFIIQKDRPFSSTEMGRRTAVEFAGTTFDVASVEDVIIAKLEWSRISGSPRQLEDVATLVRTSRAESRSITPICSIGLIRSSCMISGRRSSLRKVHSIVRSCALTLALHYARKARRASVTAR